MRNYQTFIRVVMSGKAVISEYEQIRLRNIADNKAVLAKLVEDLEPLTGAPVKATPRKRKLSSQQGGSVRKNPSRSARYQPYLRDAPMTRARSRRGSVASSTSSGTSSDDSSSPTDQRRLVIKFGSFFNKARRSVDGTEAGFGDEDEDYSLDEADAAKMHLPKRPYRKTRIIKLPEEITDEDVDMVSEHVCEKKYDSVDGSTCHQCRQKTNDMKTICRSGSCFGVRGQFCGPCLRNRYGEDAKKALKNPAWICPPCRGICNCSFCRKKNGKSCTGILIHLAREHGYKDVNSYLLSFK